MLAAAAVLACVTAAASAQQSAVELRARAAPVGWVGLVVGSSSGGTATVGEVRGGRVHVLRTLVVPAGGEAPVDRAAPWRCRPRDRVFSVTLTAPDGSTASATASIRTPSCDGRFQLAAVPGRPLVGRRVHIRLEDRWKVGSPRARVCANGPGVERCRHVRAGTDGWSWAPPRPGTWRLTGRVDGTRVSRVVRVRPRGGRLRLVAAGDSMIQIIDFDLRDRLAGRHVAVRYDDHVSTGITKPFMLDWVRHARRDARTRRPDVTVMFLGANDGYALPTGHGQAPCCGRSWVRAYADRAGAMMRAYGRHGRGRVYWMLLPTPRGREFREVFAGVNAALRRAAAQHPDTVRLVDLGATFTPHGRFQQSIRWHGRRVSVRQGDGVHLNTAGASIAATLIIRAMRRDGVL